MRREPLSSDEIDQLARKRAGAKLGWSIHAAVYVVVNLLLFAMSQHAFGTHGWSVAPLLGWGLGLVLHGVAVFLLGSGEGLRERLVENERNKLRRERSEG